MFVQLSTNEILNVTMIFRVKIHDTSEIGVWFSDNESNQRVYKGHDAEMIMGALETFMRIHRHILHEVSGMNQFFSGPFGTPFRIGGLPPASVSTHTARTATASSGHTKSVPKPEKSELKVVTNVRKKRGRDSRTPKK